MTRARLITLLKIIVAVGLIFWVVNQAGPEEIARTLRHIQLESWVIGLLFVIAANTLALLRWHVLMRSVGLNSTPWLAIRLGFIGVFFNNVLPGLTGGDVVKAIYVTRENPQQRAGAVVSVIVDRIIGIVALALIAAVIIPFGIDRYGQAAIGIYGFLAAAGLGAVLALSRRAKARLRGLLQVFGRQSPGDGTSLLGKIDQAVSMYRDRLPTVGVALLMSFGVHMAIIVSLTFFGQALAEGALAAPAQGTAAEWAQRQSELMLFRDLGLSTYCSLVPIIMIISALPVAPAGWGLGETAFRYFFETVGVAGADAVALSFTYRITATLVSLIGGVFLMFDRKRVMEAGREVPSAAGADPPAAPQPPESE